MESNAKFPVYDSYIFELLFKNRLFNYISRKNYYILQNIESHSIYYEQVFLRLQQSNHHIHIWLIFDELYAKIGYICEISISVCYSVSRVCFCSQWYQQFIDTLETRSTFLTVVYFLDIKNTCHFVEDFDLKAAWIFKSSLNSWEDKSIFQAHT